MKRFIVLLTVLVVASFAVGCSEADVASKGTADPASATAPAAQVELKSEYAVGEIIAIEDMEMTVVSAQDFAAPNEYEVPEEGKVYLIVNITLENKGDAAADFNAFNYKIQDANGVQTDTAFVTSVPNEMGSGSLAPGGKLNSNIVFEVPVDKVALKLVMVPNMFLDQQILVKLTD